MSYLIWALEMKALATSYAKLRSEQKLVGGWTNPSEKYARQIENLPQIGVKIKKYLKPPPKRLSICWLTAFQATRFEPSWQPGCIRGPPDLPRLGTVGSLPVPAFFDGRQLPPGATRFRKSEIPWGNPSPLQSSRPRSYLLQSNICLQQILTAAQWSKKYHQIHKFWSCCQLHIPFFMPGCHSYNTNGTKNLSWTNVHFRAAAIFAEFSSHPQALPSHRWIAPGLSSC